MLLRVDETADFAYDLADGAKTLCDAGLTAEQVLRDAEAEFARVERDLYVIARQLWGTTFPGKELPPEWTPDAASADRAASDLRLRAHERLRAAGVYA